MRLPVPSLVDGQGTFARCSHIELRQLFCPLSGLRNSSRLDSIRIPRIHPFMKIAKEFRWEMGHRLPNHDGACRNLHGHSYRMVVEVEGEVNPETGMVIDFADISAKVKPLVAELDHAFLCQEDDVEVRELLESLNLKRILIPVPSTVENICGLFVERLTSAFAAESEVQAFTVRIWETASSVAEIRQDV